LTATTSDGAESFERTAAEEDGKGLSQRRCGSLYGTMNAS